MFMNCSWTVHEHVQKKKIFGFTIFLHVHRETSDLDNELPEESDQFRSLHTVSLVKHQSIRGPTVTQWRLHLSLIGFLSRTPHQTFKCLYIHQDEDFRDSRLEFGSRDPVVNLSSGIPWYTSSSTVNLLHNCTCSTRVVYVQCFYIFFLHSYSTKIVVPT